MDGTAAKEPARASFWCKACGQPVRLTGSTLWPDFRKAVHAATGEETGPGYGEDGRHAAQPTDEDPVLRAQADEVEREFGGLFRISVRFRGLWRAEWKEPPGPGTPLPVEAHSAARMRAELRAVLAMTAPEAAR